MWSRRLSPLVSVRKGEYQPLWPVPTGDMPLRTIGSFEISTLLA